MRVDDFVMFNNDGQQLDLVFVNTKLLAIFYPYITRNLFFFVD